VYDLPFTLRFPILFSVYITNFYRSGKLQLRAESSYHSTKKMNVILYANDQVLIVKSEDELQKQRMP
jgi:hypothetical protein